MSNSNQPPPFKVSAQLRTTWRPDVSSARAVAASTAPPPSTADIARLIGEVHRLWGEGRLDAAMIEARKALSLAPDNVEALGSAGALAVQIGDLDQAERWFGQAIARMPEGTPDRAHVESLRALALARLRRWSEAYAIVSAIPVGGYVPAQVNWRVGRVLAMINCAGLAVDHLRAACDADPERADFLINYADALRDAGRLDKAAAAYERALAIAPGSGSAFSALAHLKVWPPEANLIARLRQQLQADELPELERAFMLHALFKVLDDAGRTEAAWRHLDLAKALARKASSADWNGAMEATEYAQLKAGFPAASFAPASSQPAQASDGRPRRRPIFVMGLPRSGTTLVERILGAHSQVTPIGETPMFSRLFRPEWDKACMAAGPAEAAGRIDWAALAQGYLDETAFLAGDAAFSVDKMPDTALLAGPIRKAFPDAILVLVTRAPMDVLFGCYKIPLTFGWARRTEDLGEHYLNFADLMAHWRASLGDGLVEVSYERLVSDPAAEIAALLQRCGLPFEDACLRPHETPGAIASSSSAQARRPISRDAVGGWRRYETELAGLAGRLQAAGVTLD